MSFSAATPATQREILAGLAERVTFHKERNGFCVLQVKARGQRDLITVVGHAAAISAGEFIQASGAWVNDRTYPLGNIGSRSSQDQWQPHGILCVHSRG